MFIPNLELPYFLPGINSATQRNSMQVKSKSILSVARRAAFGDLEKPLSQELCIYLSIKDRGTRRKSTDTEMDIVYPIITNMRQNGWDLYLDDERTPDCAINKNVGRCIIARTNRAAIHAVNTLGLPKVIHLDYKLRNSTTIAFVTWLYSYMKTKNIDYINTDPFVLLFLTTSITGKMKIIEKINQFKNGIVDIPYLEQEIETT
jgi:hypothetical protein